MVDRRVVRPVEQGYLALLHERFELGHGGVVFEFHAVFFGKGIETILAMIEPRAQRRRRRDLLEPEVDRRLFLAQAARPESARCRSNLG